MPEPRISNIGEPVAIPLSLYVHIPWCIKKCPYCDFNSHEKNAAFDEDAYVQALLADLDHEAEHAAGRAFHSIFFGGGTPSLFSADAIGRIIAHAHRRFGGEAAEITLEANPGTFEQAKFRDFRHAGVNRLSIGIQSFNDVHLQALGRIHDGKQARSAIDTARAAGFDNINLDLMFALPGQCIAEAVEDVRQACAFDAQHVSHYQLTIEANTRFHKYPPELPAMDASWEMQTQCQQQLSDAGYAQYEVSAWAKPGRQSAHNLNYWRFGDYIGIGAGAHSKLSSAGKDGQWQIQRHWKRRQPKDYMQGVAGNKAVSERQQLTAKDIVFEFLLNALRLKQGVAVSTFEQRTGLPASTLQQAVANIDKELLQVDAEYIRTTEKGYLFLNELLEALI